ncbi:MAG: DUF6516 family protein [Bacteroidales bacterium]|nr:DUF6516 family protein [Bacteroidales bacterium]MCF8455270.1 DUF6516 family protein [Bacteroidales bacterium]
MNSIIKAYFVEIELRLLENPLYTEYLILRRDILYSEGKIRLTVKLKNEITIELFEYLEENEGKLSSKKYSYHWQDKKEKLILRWDNAPHHKELENFPHHIHFEDNRITPNTSVPNILTILDAIELGLRS